MYPVQLHESLCNLTGLTSLSLQYGQIETISPCVSRLRELRDLDLSRNSFAEAHCMLGSSVCRTGTAHGVLLA